jgi:hypothetical protein
MATRRYGPARWRRSGQAGRPPRPASGRSTHSLFVPSAGCRTSNRIDTNTEERSPPAKPQRRLRRTTSSVARMKRSAIPEHGGRGSLGYAGAEAAFGVGPQDRHPAIAIGQARDTEPRRWGSRNRYPWPAVVIDKADRRGTSIECRDGLCSFITRGKGPKMWIHEETATFVDPRGTVAADTRATRGGPRSLHGTGRDRRRTAGAVRRN